MISTQVYKMKVPMMQTITVTIVCTGTPFGSEAGHDIQCVIIIVCVCVHMIVCDKMSVKGLNMTHHVIAITCVYFVVKMVLVCIAKSLVSRSVRAN